MLTKFCTVASNICGPSERDLLHVTLLGHQILSWRLGFFKYLCTPVLNTIFFPRIFLTINFIQDVHTTQKGLLAFFFKLPEIKKSLYTLLRSPQNTCYRLPLVRDQIRDVLGG
jgi:hypothetical protein